MEGSVSALISYRLCGDARIPSHGSRANPLGPSLTELEWLIKPELEQQGWDSCFIGDSHGIPTAVKTAAAWQGEVVGMALSHARLSEHTEGERAPVNKAVWDAMGQLLRNDYRAFVRHGLTQLIQGAMGDELAKQMLVPLDHLEPVGFDVEQLKRSKLGFVERLFALEPS